MNDSESSGERNRNSLNLLYVIDCNRFIRGVVGVFGVCCRTLKKLQNYLLVKHNWKVGP